MFSCYSSVCKVLLVVHVKGHTRLWCSCVTHHWSSDCVTQACLRRSVWINKDTVEKRLCCDIVQCLCQKGLLKALPRLASVPVPTVDTSHWIQTLTVWTATDFVFHWGLWIICLHPLKYPLFKQYNTWTVQCFGCSKDWPAVHILEQIGKYWDLSLILRQ